jgi:hypothetical protein
VIVLQAVADGRLGGGTTHVLQLIETLGANLPCELHLVSDTGSPALVEAARLGAVCHGIDFFTMRLDPRIALRLGMLIRRLRPALVHAHGARAGLPLAGLTRRAPLFYSVHGYHFVGKRGAARRLAIAAERWCSARAARTLFVCQHDRRLAEEAGILWCRSPFIGVRISWLMLARNSLLARLAAIARSRASTSSALAWRRSAVRASTVASRCS